MSDKTGMTIIQLYGWWWPSYSGKEAKFWGWRHSLTIGPVLIFWGLMTEAELIEDARGRFDGAMVEQDCCSPPPQDGTHLIAEAGKA